MSRPELEQILQRIAALEATATVSSGEDFSDPPLYFTKSDGTPVNPDSFEKIPDLIKDLPIFNGDPRELNSWISDVDSLVKLYQTTINHPVEMQNKFHMICKFIRRKIRGEANDSLVASNVNINWSLIKRTLVTYYGEKRDLETLDFQLMSVQQRGSTLETYYDEVNRLMSLIANQIKTDDRFRHPEASKAMIDTYNRKAVDSFIRGLDGDVYKFIRNYEPTSLASAYSYCISFQNIECRKMLNKPRQISQPTAPRNLIPQISNKPPLPPKPFFNRNVQPAQRYFVPQPKHFNYRNTNNIPNVPPRNPFRQPPPEPMDVDPSIRSRQVNYGNRPNLSQNIRPPKRQRVFNVETASKDEEDPAQFSEYDDTETSSYERYMRNIDRQEYDEPNETEEAELHFLE